jgi:serine/threonine protein kinase
MNLNVRNFGYTPGAIAKNPPPTTKSLDTPPRAGRYAKLNPKVVKTLAEVFFRSKGVEWNQAGTRQGAYGSVFDMSDEFTAMLIGSLPDPENEVFARVPQTTIDRFAVKVQALDSLDAEIAAIEEDTVHKEISDAPVNPDLGGIRGSDVVPRYVYGCTLVLGGFRMRFSFAEFVQGETFRSFVKDRPAQIGPIVDVFVYLERAALFLWTLGYSHADFHADNVLVETKKKMPKIIDFGFAVRMSPGKVRAIEREAARILSVERGSTDAIARAFETYYAQNMKNTVAVRKNVDVADVKSGQWWFNPDNRLLQKVVEYLEIIAASERDLEYRLSKARLRAYGIKSHPI